MRAPVALGFALVALLAVAASAAAEPATPLRPYEGRLTPVTLRVTDPAGDTLALTSSPRPTPRAAAFVDSGAAPVPTLGPRPQRAPDRGVFVKPTPTPKPPPAAPAAPARASGGGGGGGNTSGGGGGRGGVLRGLASWYCNNDGSRAQISACHYRYPDTGGFQAYAAAGPKLRAALGGGDRWRGRVVSVNGLRVKLIDWCQCYRGQRHEKVIDLYLDVYRRVGGNVTIRW